MRFALASLLMFALSACATTPARHYSGVYVTAFETEAFYSYDGGDPYWVSADAAAQAALQAPIPHPFDPQTGVRVVVEVQGVLSPPGRYGHLGAYTRELHVTRVLSAHLERQT
jgi:hypothetical protein